MPESAQSCAECGKGIGHLLICSQHPEAAAIAVTMTPRSVPWAESLASEPESEDQFAARVIGEARTKAGVDGPPTMVGVVEQFVFAATCDIDQGDRALCCKGGVHACWRAGMSDAEVDRRMAADRLWSEQLEHDALRAAERRESEARAELTGRVRAAIVAEMGTWTGRPSLVQDLLDERIDQALSEVVVSVFVDVLTNPPAREDKSAEMPGPWGVVGWRRGRTVSTTEPVDVDRLQLENAALRNLLEAATVQIHGEWGCGDREADDWLPELEQEMCRLKTGHEPSKVVERRGLAGQLLGMVRVCALCDAWIDWVT